MRNNHDLACVSRSCDLQSFITLHSALVRLQDYTIFFPLTRNTNKDNIKAAGDNVTTEDYMVAPSDCEYKSGIVSASSVGSEFRSAAAHMNKDMQCPV